MSDTILSRIIVGDSIRSGSGYWFDKAGRFWNEYKKRMEGVTGKQEMELVLSGHLRDEVLCKKKYWSSKHRQELLRNIIHSGKEFKASFDGESFIGYVIRRKNFLDKTLDTKTEPAEIFVMSSKLGVEWGDTSTWFPGNSEVIDLHLDDKDAEESIIHHFLWGDSLDQVLSILDDKMRQTEFEPKRLKSELDQIRFKRSIAQAVVWCWDQDLSIPDWKTVLADSDITICTGLNRSRMIEIGEYLIRRANKDGKSIGDCGRLGFENKTALFNKLWKDLYKNQKSTKVVKTAFRKCRCLKRDDPENALSGLQETIQNAICFALSHNPDLKKKHSDFYSDCSDK